MYVSDYEQALFSLDPNLEKLRDLKEKYIRFNRSHADRPDEARSAPDALISEYKSSGYTIFEEVAKALSAYKQAVINSFTVIERTDSKGHTIRSRLSNGPMESLNRVPKDMKGTQEATATLSIYATGFCLQCVKMHPYLHHLRAMSR